MKVKWYRAVPANTLSFIGAILLDQSKTAQIAIALQGLPSNPAVDIDWSLDLRIEKRE